jgi:predicted Zn-dependent protease
MHRIQPIDRRDLLLSSMSEELQRNLRDLSVEEFGPPYFLSYSLKDYQNLMLWGERGSIFERNQEQNRFGYAEVRVGDYQMDNTLDGFLENLENEGPSPDNTMPVDDDPRALRFALWRLTDIKYKEALRRYLGKRGRMIHEAFRNRETPDFTRERAYRYIQQPIEARFDPEPWEDLVRRSSAQLGSHRFLIHSKVEFRATHESRYYVNSEGSTIYTEARYYGVQATGATLAQDGMPLRNFYSAFARRPDELPDEAQLGTGLEQLARELAELREAAVMEPYSGPTLLSPQSAGVFLHEAIGHRLEGERQISDLEGQTFRGRMGQRILPDFLSIFDDPSAVSHNGKSLHGSYEFDDEGTPSQRAGLVERGVLRDFLRSRTPVEGKTQSNGHGRHGCYEDPMARMSNLFVQAECGLEEEALDRMLLGEIDRQKQPFGLFIAKVEGGETSTSRYDLQAFSGLPVLVYKVLPDGEKLLTRGAEFIGTPLLSANKILAAGRSASAYHGYCGAESGWVPVSTIAPSLLLQEMELQRAKTRNLNPPILPPPP